MFRTLTSQTTMMGRDYDDGETPTRAAVSNKTLRTWPRPDPGPTQESGMRYGRFCGTGGPKNQKPKVGGGTTGRHFRLCDAALCMQRDGVSHGPKGPRPASTSDSSLTYDTSYLGSLLLDAAAPSGDTPHECTMSSPCHCFIGAERRSQSGPADLTTAYDHPQPPNALLQPRASPSYAPPAPCLLMPLESEGLALSSVQ